ncbi:MAG: hypothetical protein KC912_21030 [Proteobacteria bacterium]|nr:hypothetical protein [Pseudomonadota bacterium]
MALALLGCGAEPVPTEAPTPAPVASPTAEPGQALPAVALRVPTRAAKTPAPVAVTPDIEAARAILERVVRAEAVVDDHPWALGHALLAFGPDLTLTDGRSAIDQLFADFAEEVVVGDETLIRFPSKRGSIRIEPHSELLLKALTEIGVSPDRTVQVGGNPHVVGELYRHALSRAWTDGKTTGYGAYNDAPWALQGLATWAPGDLEWQAEGHAMSLDRMTTDVVAQAVEETAFMRDAVAAGTTFEKKGQGIFAYTCGGAHLIQGVALAVGSGYGTDADRVLVQDEIALLFHRLPFEVQLVDSYLQRAPEYQLVLVEQRLKFLGHWVETMHKAAAMGLFEPTEDQKRQMGGAMDELIRTVLIVEKMGVYGKLAEVRASNEQTYLDYVGDSAHALRAIDVATGRGTVLY